MTGTMTFRNAEMVEQVPQVFDAPGEIQLGVVVAFAGRVDLESVISTTRVTFPSVGAISDSHAVTIGQWTG